MKSLLTPKELKTIKYYDNEASNWASGHQTNMFWGSMDEFYKLLPSGKVIEIGCGGGRDAKDYLVKKYNYIGTDVSAGLLKEAKKLNPKGIFLNQSVYSLNFPENSFDGFWASAVLLHVPKKRISEALNKIHNIVMNNGIGFISLKKGEGERVDEDDRLFSYYSQEEFDSILQSNGFKIINFGILPMSEKTVWLKYLVKVVK